MNIGLKSAKTLFSAVCISMAASTSVLAATVNFEFSFSDGVDTITGLIEGLDSDGLNQAASQITINGVFDTYIATTFLSNSFDVVSGVIDTGIADLYVENIPGVTLEGELQFLSFLAGLAQYSEDPTMLLGSPIFMEEEFQTTNSSMAPVPLPAGVILLLLGLCGIAAVSSRSNT